MDRKQIPLASGVFDYFSDALVEVAKVSFAGNEKHNPGEPLHWSRDKSADHADALLRHFKDRGAVDPENGTRHSAEMVWRALAILQEELEAAGLAPLARGARLPAAPRPSRVERTMPCSADDHCDLCGEHAQWNRTSTFETCPNCLRRA